MPVSRPHLSEDARYSEIFAKVPERYRHFITPFGNDAESFWGVESGNGGHRDLRTTFIHDCGQGDDTSAPIPKFDLAPLQALPELQCLSLERCSLINQQCLANLRKLRTLLLFEVHNFTGGAYFPPALTDLDMSFCRMKHYRGPSSKETPKLTHIKYYHCPAKGLQREVTLPHLSKLELYGTPIHAELTSRITLARIGRALRGKRFSRDQEIRDQIGQLEKNGVEISFHYEGM